MAATWRRSGRQRASLAGNRSTPTERPTGATQAKSGEPLFWRKRATGDFAAEIEAHIQLEAERLREQGLSEPAARAAARRAFGNVLRAQERFYESGRWRWWDDLARDLRYALRLLRRSPGFTAIAVATLALAIGANAVAFGVLNAALLRPLNVPDPQSLVALQPQRGDNSLHLSYPTYLDYRDRNHSFAGLAANRIGQAGLDAGANPAPVWLDEVSGNYFDVLRLRPYLGRFFHGSEEHGANSMPEVVLAWAYWHSHFHGDPGVVGRTLRLNKQPFAVVGVAPPGFNGTLLFGAPALFVPLVNEQQIEGSNYLNARGEHALFMTFGHLKPGVTAAQAIADLNAIGAALRRRFPLSELATDFTLASPSLYGNFLGPPVRAFAAALMLLAGLVLLAACANLGSLFAARATDHAREVAVRLALGAGWGRVARQLCTEALLIALAGGGLGLWGGVALLRWLSAWHPFPQAPITLPLSPDAHVYAAALLLAVASAFLFIAEPVRQVWRTQPYTIIKQGAARRPRRMNAREWLLGVQIALCAVLVTASLVAVRGLARSLQGNVGFEPANVMLAQSDLGMAGYGNAAAPPMQRRMLAAVAALPGVQSVGMADWAPLGLLGWNSEQVFTAQTTDLRAANAAADAAIFNASPGYLETARTTLLAGRSFTWHDDQAAPRVAVVNRRFAMLLFGSVARALGHDFKLLDGTRVQVVGVVEDGKYNSLTEAPQPAMFLSLLQSPARATALLVRSLRDPQVVAAAIQDRLHRLDPSLPVVTQTWSNAMNAALFPARMATAALGILGALGALLSLTGIFGMAAYSVSQRKHELGIRMALGAQPAAVLQAALGRALKLLAVGSAIGLGLGIFSSRVLALLVYQATPRDPLVLVGAVLAMALLGLLAAWIPAQRALALDPVLLLRDQ